MSYESFEPMTYTLRWKWVATLTELRHKNQYRIPWHHSLQVRWWNIWGIWFGPLSEKREQRLADLYRGNKSREPSSRA
jgi:hypothetical protein